MDGCLAKYCIYFGVLIVNKGNQNEISRYPVFIVILSVLSLHVLVQ